MKYREQITELLKKGLLKKEIAHRLGISYATVKNHSKGLSSKKLNTAYSCRSCSIEGTEHFYSSVKYYCKKCFNESSYQATKDKIAEYMETRGGAKCQRCGYDRYVGALEFHHRDPALKDPNWSRSWSMPRLKEELDKCDILCSNCHREVHAEMRKN